MKSSSYVAPWPPLARAWDHDQGLPHALLVTGAETGWPALEEAYARQLLCEEGGIEGCACRSCRIPLSSHPDYGLLAPDPKVIKRESVEAWVSTLIMRPLWSRAKTLIIRHADKMTPPAESYLLKHLEEPPEGVHYLLLTEHPDALMATIQSRCQTVRLVHDAVSDRDFRVESLWSDKSLTVDRVMEASFWVRDQYVRTSDVRWLETWDVLSRLHDHLMMNGNADIAKARLRLVWPRER